MTPCAISFRIMWWPGDNWAQFSTLSGYTHSFRSVQTYFVVKYGQLFVLNEECNRNF